MNRVAIFAHYDRDGLIDDYVIYYLRGLREVAKEVIFISDCKLQPNESSKLDGLATLVSAERHGEYDFGSWKRGFAYLGENLAEWDEIIIANDSCYAPVYSFKDVFASMDRAECDFWGAGATEIRGKFDHISSYFMVFRKPILIDHKFRTFWETICPQSNTGAVVRLYEKGLSHLLLQSGYRWKTVTPIAFTGSFLTAQYLNHTLKRYQAPWLKVRLFRDNPLCVNNLSAALHKIDRYYPRRLIDAHISRVVTPNPPHHHYRFHLSPFQFAPANGKVKLEGKIKRNRWWKLYAYLFGVPVFALVLPLRRKTAQ